MKLSALSPFFLSSLFLVASPLPSYAQVALISELPTPSLLRVPQSLPPTIYNPADDHPELPVPPSTDLSTMQAESPPIREYIFQSGRTVTPQPQAQTVSPGFPTQPIPTIRL
ncbi:MAG: hypothetical protein VKJ02_17475 [Snowella sp.]|nr:hypothetical protein [Snowella sp.]